MLAGGLLLTAASAAIAQRRVTGRVRATTGEPLVSATINVQGTTIGTYTTDSGTFALPNVPNGPQTLVVRRIGYRRTLVALGAQQADVEVRMERDVLELEKQVITGTTTTISSANAANAVSVVSADQLTRTPTPTLENALQAKIPGAIITQNSGAPGGGMQVQMRGITSINAASSPLYVVDGVIVSNAQVLSGLNSVTNAGGGINSSQDQPVNRIADLNPADIETIEVLKGASAGAIYGSKGSNGVILITTKRGAAGAPTLNVTQRVGQYQIAHKLGLRCFSSAAEAEDWYTNVIGGTTLPYAWNPSCNDFEGQLYGGNDLSYETNLSVRGGTTAGTSYYIGGLAKRDNAIQRSTYYQKQSITANVGQLIGSRLTVSSRNQIIHDLTDRGISGNDNSPVVSPGDIFSQTPTFVPLNQKTNGVYMANPFLAEKTNPFQNSELVKNPEDVFRYIGSVDTRYSAFRTDRQTLDLTLIGGLDTYNYNSKLLSQPNAYFESADGLPGTIVTNRTTSVYANLNFSGAHHYVANRFTTTTSFGMRNEYRQADGILNQGRNLPAGVSNVNFAVQQSLGESQSKIRDLGYYAQEELLTLSDRLLLTAAINAERSSVNGDQKKFYSYPKFAASYRIPWLPSFTDEVKVRAAYGKAGNQPPFGTAFTSLPTGIYSGVIGARPSTVAGNPQIKPETSTETEGGLDAQFLNGRLSLEATAYRKVVTDLILQATIAPTTGFTSKFVNGGTLQNTGTEFGLNITPITNRDFTWVSRTTYARNAGRITKLDVPCFNGGAFFSLRYGAPYICEGFSQGTVQAYNGYDTTFSSTGAFVSRARHVQNFESSPDFTMGFSNDLSYKQFTLYGLLDWRKGGKAVDLTGLYFDPTELLSDLEFSRERFGRFLKGYAAYLEPAGFVKLREVTLTYTLPRTWAQRVFTSRADQVRLEVSGRNLKTWTDYKGYDPEVSNFGNQNIGRFQDVTPYPPSRSFFFSIGANF